LRLAYRALADVGQTDNFVLIGHLYILVAGLRCVAGNFTEGRLASLKAIELLEPLNAFDLLPIAYSHLGINLAGLGKLALAIKQHEKAVELGVRSRSPLLRAQALCNLAECYLHSGQFEKALLLCRDMLGVCAAIQNKSVTHAGHLCLLETYLAMGDYAAAWAVIKQLKRTKARDMPVYLRAQAYYATALYHFSVLRLKESNKQLRELRRLPSRETPIPELGFAQILDARVRFQGGDTKALATLVRLDNSFARRHWSLQRCSTQVELAQIYLDAGNVNQAYRYARNAGRLARRIPAYHLEAEAHLIMGLVSLHPDQVENSNSDPEALSALAKQMIERAAELGQKYGLDTVLWRSHYHLARMAAAAGNPGAVAKECEMVFKHVAKVEQKRLPRLKDRGYDCRQIAMNECRKLYSVSTAHNAAGIEDAQLRVLFKASCVVNSLVDINKLLVKVADLAQDLPGIERTLLFIYKRETNELRYAGGWVTESVDPQIPIYVSNVVKLVHAQRKPFITANAACDGRLNNDDNQTYLCGGIFCGPLTSWGEYYGVLYAENDSPCDEVSEGAINTFAAFCNMSAIAIGNAVKHGDLKANNERLERIVNAGKLENSGIVGASEAIRLLRQRIRVMAASPLDVLIVGESGTGKELVARALYLAGRRSEGKFVPLDCGSLSENLMESELFGYRKGSFTGANESRAGLLESANGGMVFFDEISNLPYRLQGKLLRVLQEREIRRVGEVTGRRIDVQIIAATNRDLRREIRKGHFRKDLFYRLNAVEIAVPPLREHSEDIPELVESFLAQTARMEGGRWKTISEDALRVLLGYTFPGNVRELKNIIQNAYYSCPGLVIGIEDLPVKFSADGEQVAGNDEVRAKRIMDTIQCGGGDFDTLVKIPFGRREYGNGVIREIIRRGLKQTRGRYREVLRLLGVPDDKYAVTMQFLKRHACYLDFRPFRCKS
jgi:DNA-binding NtrC family response regulator/tetratricopeptide (TPR) repeat protein